MAEKAINIIAKKLGQTTPKCKTEVTPIYGGHMGPFDDFLKDAIQNSPAPLDHKNMRALVHNHGARYQDVLKYAKEDPTWIESVGESTVLKAEVIQAVRDEMAQKLADVVFRRTDLGTGEYPGDDTVEKCAHLMSSEMGWDKNKLNRELEEVKRTLPFNNQQITMKE
jgi:glycerol-3-phosphate dehydrogenase